MWRGDPCPDQGITGATHRPRRESDLSIQRTGLCFDGREPASKRRVTTYTSPLLPSFWHFLNHFWIGAESVNAERSILYFGGQGVGTDILRLLAWTVVIVALLVLPVSRKLAHERRARSVVAGWFTPATALRQ